ncbi:hypothetical protein AV540_20030 [Brevibacillus parabrevis]|uniref:hypothetical protein n=1 Tax=Brevibacillus parabrevis TaxID=54914 RepID=UPI0007AB610E|nr:hypothetical protein [Brevibacillus parabrevis]KZE47095.1 hypothetical protein AV540_20030 [Brevibacillus parabrevis]
MKKSVLFSGIALALAFSVIGYANASKQDDMVIVKQRIAEFKEKVDNDIASSFDINLDDLKKLDHKEVLKSEEYKGIAKIVMNIMLEQANGDVVPSIYMDEENNELYILEKQADGTNILHKYSKNNEGYDTERTVDAKNSGTDEESWNEISTEKSEGKIIEFEEVK